MGSKQTTQATFVDAARELALRVAKAADRIDRDRELPQELANAIADGGLFRLLVPRSLDGGEMDYLEFLSIVQTFAEADGSTGWCINQNNVFGTVSAFMPEQTAREIWSDRRAVVANGPPTRAEAVPEGDGYRLTGRWNFSSGFRHATWLAAPVLHSKGDGKNGEKIQTMLFPKEDAKPLDVWQVGGLRGTGSFSFEVKDLYVPAIRTFGSEAPREEGPLYVVPRTLLFAAGFATVALGVARAALRAAIELASTKRLDDRVLLKERSFVQRDVGHAEATWESARAFLLEAVSAAWKSAGTVHFLTTEERVRLRLASTHAIRQAAHVVDVAYDLCGSDAIFARNPIQRRFQDIHAITQQGQGRMTHYETAGQLFLGLEPEGMF